MVSLQCEKYHNAYTPYLCNAQTQAMKMNPQPEFYFIEQ